MSCCKIKDEFGNVVAGSGTCGCDDVRSCKPRTMSSGSCPQHTDLQNYVPYNGAISDVNLGGHNLSVKTLNYESLNPPTISANQVVPYTGAVHDVDLGAHGLAATDLTIVNPINGDLAGNADTVTTNANLTGPITSSGNATAIASKTGSGIKFVMDTSPTIADATLVGPSIDRIANLGANGFVRTTNLDGTLTTDTNTYLTAESDTLDSVVSRGATTAIAVVFGTSVRTPVVLTPQIKTDVVTPTDLTIITGVQKTLVLNTTVWNDLQYVPTSLDFGGANDPSLVNYQPGGSGAVTKLYEFAKNDLGYFTVQLPHTYKEGTDIHVHVHWTPGARGVAENGNTVGWKVLYTWADINGNFAAMQTADLSDACDGVDHKHQVTPSVTIDGHTIGKGISSMLLCQVIRSDTGADDTWASVTTGQLPLLLGVDFHHEIDTLGSRQTGAK